MDKKVKKCRKIKWLPLLIVLVVVCIILSSIYLLGTIPIKNIYIKGNQYIGDQEIIEDAKIENYPSFLKTKSSTIRKNIEKNPYIKKVIVKKGLPAKVFIQIEEKKILYRNEETGNIVLEDKTELADHNQFQVPILLNYIPDTKYDSFINGMKKVEESILNMLSEIKYDPNEQDEDRFLLHMNDGNDVYLTLTKFKQINYYEDVLEKLEGKKGILYLDSGNHFQIME